MVGSPIRSLCRQSLKEGSLFLLCLPRLWSCEHSERVRIQTYKVGKRASEVKGTGVENSINSTHQKRRVTETHLHKNSTSLLFGYSLGGQGGGVEDFLGRNPRSMTLGCSDTSPLRAMAECYLYLSFPLHLETSQFGDSRRLITQRCRILKRLVLIVLFSYFYDLWISS